MHFCSRVIQKSVLACLNTREKFFLFFTLLREKAESLGAVEKLSPDELSRTDNESFFVRNDE